MKPLSPTMQMRQTLHERFPRCFMAKGEAKKPLAIGVFEQVLAVAVDLKPQLVAWAIQNYVMGRKYQENMIAGAQRVNLDGSTAGEVTEQDAVWARIMLGKMERRWARRDKKKKKHPQTPTDGEVYMGIAH